MFDLSNPLTIVLLGAASFFVGKLLFRKDNQIEERRKRAIEVSNLLSGLGLSRLPNLLNEYAVGNYSGMAQQLKELHDLIKDSHQRRAEFTKVLQALLTEHMKDSDLRPALIKLFVDLRTAHDPDFNPRKRTSS